LSTCTVVIVTYNGWELVKACLSALENELRPGIEVVVVDNGSSDGTPEKVREGFESVQVIELGWNLGFAAGNNLGIRPSTSDFVLLLNSDVIVRPGFIGALLEPFDAAPRLGSVGATMVFHTEPRIVASAGIEIYANGLALDRSVGDQINPDGDYSPVFGSSAGACVYRREALNDVGLFPEPFFMYLEDVDLAWRLRLRGWDSLISHRAVAEHHYSASSREGSSFKRKLVARNRLWYMARCLPTWLLARNWWRIVAYDGAVALSAPIRKDGASLAGRASALSGMRDRLHERAVIQRRSTVTKDEIERWIQPSPSPRTVIDLRELTSRYARGEK
jgi:GT2 family glycosyltransferase